MSIKPLTADNLGQGAAIGTWAGLSGGDTGQPFTFANLADRTVQAFGTIGGDITIEGSNDPRVTVDPDNAVWATLLDNFGNPAVFSSAGMILLSQAPRWIRPNCASGTTNATVIILANAS